MPITLRALSKLYSSMFCGAKQLHTSCSRQGTLYFKRDWAVPLPRLGKPIRFKKRHNVYRVCGTERFPENIDIILAKDSLEYGVTGEVLTLERKVARTLIRHDEAVYASPENLEDYQSSLIAKSAQTTSGRRMLLWLKSMDSLKCPMRQGVSWTLTPEIISRALQRAHKLVIPPSALTLPRIIKEDDDGAWGQHEIEITVNEVDTVPMNIDVVVWKPDDGL